jgi:hypothetical protein
VRAAGRICVPNAGGCLTCSPDTRSCAGDGFDIALCRGDGSASDVVARCEPEQGWCARWRLRQRLLRRRGDALVRGL